jgi:hypothetical protein
MHGYRCFAPLQESSFYHIKVGCGFEKSKSGFYDSTHTYYDRRIGIYHRFFFAVWARVWMDFAGVLRGSVFLGYTPVANWPD